MGQYVFKLPDVGEGTAEAEIVAWHVRVGDVVEEDAPLVDVMTDKATVEMTAPVAGKVISIHGEPGDMAPVGGAIAVFETEGEEAAPVSSPARGGGVASNARDGGGATAQPPNAGARTAPSVSSADSSPPPKSQGDFGQLRFAGREAAGGGGAFRQGFFTNALNPKVALFYLAALPQFAGTGADAPMIGLMLLAIHAAMGFVWLSFIAFAAARARTVVWKSAWVRWLEGAVGFFFLGVAGRLALTRS